MTDPIIEARQSIPFWMRDIKLYDGLEIHPVADSFDEGRHPPRPTCAGPDNTWFEQCEPEEAKAWSVFGHLIAGGVECFEDFDTEAKALRFAQKLLDAYPHLGNHGLMG